MNDYNVVTVRIETWEFECCAPLPVVGEKSAWALHPTRESLWFDGTVHGGIYPDDVEPTAGIVLSIRLERGEFVEQEPRHWVFVPGSSETYRRVEASPRWFRRFGDFDFEPQNRIETGLVVELATTRAPFR
ncbi:DUF6578 domain-containing protein [Rhodococcus qingshengii]|jgi:hypothetical protein|uniref:DUF6578 domain-containing protein n=1 Tax=Rhodococcus qingshengii TaxID=334542 RepID=UPI000E46E36B|nr:DUF6578 domain-containing protein [Rhodococcus qingshengii]RGP49703.1 hypothetical protein AWH04_02175 [Rhodococcus erythropolis]THJ67282.1 hypothetical protein EU244_26775 [Rhodococcus qingshengii]